MEHGDSEHIDQVHLATFSNTNNNITTTQSDDVFSKLYLNPTL